MIQGGDPNSVNADKHRVLGSDRCPKLPAEILPHRFHKKGALAAARLPDRINPRKESSACQFFIVHGYKYTDAKLEDLSGGERTITEMQKAWYKVRGGAPYLDGQYTVFGEVLEGLEVLDLVAAMSTGLYVKDRPDSDVKIKVKILD